MPLFRYQIRAEYGLADPELYTSADKDDPEALLEGVAMAGLVGILRQLGDLAEFAAEIFNGLHEEVMATSARGHSLMLRVQQLEAEIPVMEKAFLSQASQPPLDSESGIQWHPNNQVDHNLFTQGDMPRFILNSYEACRGPPKLFMLDRFDVAGAGACLKRYSDPSFFKTYFTSSGNMESDLQRERKPRKAKRKGIRARNDEMLDSVVSDVNRRLPSSSEKLPHNMAVKRVKLRARGSSNLSSISVKCFMESLFETDSLAENVLVENTEDPTFTPEKADSSHQIREVHEVINNYGNNSQFQDPTRNLNIENVIDEDKNNSSGQKVGDHETNLSSVPINQGVFSDATIKTSKILEADTLNDTENNTFTKLEQENLSADAESITDSSVDIYVSDDVASELDNYVDALNTMDSEAETDNESKAKPKSAISQVEPEVRSLEDNAPHHAIHVKSLSSNFCKVSGKDLHHEGLPKKKASRSMDYISDLININSSPCQKLEDHCLDQSPSADLSDNTKMLSNGDQKILLGVSKEIDPVKEETESLTCTIKNEDYSDNAQDKPCPTTDFTNDSTSVFEMKPESSEKHFDSQANFQQVLSDSQDPTTARRHANSSGDNKLDKTFDTSCTPSEFSKASISSHNVEAQPFRAHSDPQSNVEQVSSALFCSNTALNTVGCLETSSKAGNSLQVSLDGVHINDDHANEVSSGSGSHFEVIEKKGDLTHKNNHVDIHPTETCDVSSDLPPLLSLEMVTAKVVIDNVPSQREGLKDVDIEAASSSQISQYNKNDNAFASTSDRYPVPPAVTEKEANRSERDQLGDGIVKSEVECPRPVDSNSNRGLSDGFVAGSVVDIPSNGADSICLESKDCNINGAFSESGNELHLVGISQFESLKDHYLELHRQSLEEDASSTFQNSSDIKNKTLLREALHDLYDDEVKDGPPPDTDHVKLSCLSEKLDSRMNDVSPVILPDDVMVDTKVGSEDVTLASIQEPHSIESTSEVSIVDDATSFNGETLISGASSPKSTVTLDAPKLQVPQQEEVESPRYYSSDRQQIIDSSDEPDLSVLNHVSQTEPLCHEVSVEDVHELCNKSPEASDEEASRILLDNMKLSDENSFSPSNHSFCDVPPEPSTALVVTEQHNESSTLVTDPVSLIESPEVLTACSVMNHHETEAAAAQHDDSDPFTSETEFANANIEDLQVADEAKVKSELSTPLSFDCFHLDMVSNSRNSGKTEQVQGDVKLDGENEVESSVLNGDLDPDDLSDENTKSATIASENHCNSPPSGLEINQGSNDISSKLPSGQCMGSELIDVAQTLEMSASEQYTDLSDMSPNDASLDLTDCTGSSLESPMPSDTAAISNLTKEQAAVLLKSSPEFGERSIESTDDLHIPQSTGSCNNDIIKSPEDGSTDGHPNLPVAMISGLDPPVYKSILKQASVALMQQEILEFDIPSQNVLQSREIPLDPPPLPPLPPLQWRVGKLQTGTSDDMVNQKLHPGPNTLPPTLSESLHGFSLSVAEKTQPVYPFAHAPTSGNAKSLPFSVPEGTTLFAVSSTEGMLSIDDSGPILSQVAPQEGMSLPVHNFMATPGFTNPSSLHFSSHRDGGQFLPFKSSMPVEMPGHNDISTGLQDSNEEELKASNPFLSTSSSEDVKYQYAYSPYTVFGGEGMHVLNASMALPTQGLMPHHFYVHSPYSIPLPPMDLEIPNGRHHSILHRPRDPLIEAVASHDKSTLRKVSEMSQTSAKPKKEGTNALLEQIRKKSGNLKRTVTPKPNIKGPSTNLKVAAILEKAIAIRQACAGSDEDEDSWSDS